MTRRRLSLAVICLLLELVAVLPAFAGSTKGISCECKDLTVYEYSAMTPYTFTATGGTGPFHFTATGLPAGLTLSSSGVLSGTPTVTGTFHYQVTVKDSTGKTYSFACEIVVSPPLLSVKCPSSTTELDVVYSSVISASGGVSPYTFSIESGSLPGGLTLNSSTGKITGTPKSAGSFDFEVKVSDSRHDTGSASCSITVSSPPLALRCASSTARMGTAYSSSLEATGGMPPYKFSILSGSLPAGLTLNTSTGAITGTPTKSGTFGYTAKVVDSSNDKATASCSITVAATTTPLSLSCASSSATVGTAYSSALAALGGVSPYTFSISSGSLPPGLTLNTSTGAITGSPTTGGSYSYSGKVKDSSGATATASCSITVASATTPLSVSCASSSATVGTAYSSALVASGGVSPYTYSISTGSLPPGLTLNTSTGAITGTPTTSGPYSYTAKVVDSTSASATTSCSITVTAAPLSVSCASSSATVGSAYTSALVASGGVSPYTYSISVGSLPPGLTLNTSTGAITGSPTTGGPYSYTAKVVDSTSASATTSCSITVSVPLALSCPSSAAQVGLAYSSSLSATGGVSPYTFSISVGSLPPGLTLNTSTGAITGTPTTGGSYTFTGQVQDSTSATTTASCSIVPITVGSCLPGNSLALLAQGSTVTSYVPNAAWATSTTGVQLVPLEPTGTPVAITTPNPVNSCSSNSATGETVCTANNTDVYLITGSTLNTTLTSAADTYAGFSGGDCENCGVAINSSTNTAVITEGLSAAPSGSGIQYLNLSNNTFATPILANNEVSEDVLWDQTRNFILAPNEESNYDIYQVGASTTTEYANSTAFVGTGDSAGEDCTTGIALSTLEGSDQLYIVDLTQATFTVGPPATWTAPGQTVTFPEFAGFSAGTDGIAVAGNSHLGIVSGEFGGNQFGAFQLPATSGTGTPSFVDYAAAVLPNTPDSNEWEQGLDPHTITAYVSPNNGKAYGVMANGYFTPPTYLAIIDLQALLNAPRTPGTHTVDPTYDLVANGVVVYIATQ